MNGRGRQFSRGGGMGVGIGVAGGHQDPPRRRRFRGQYVRRRTPSGGGYRAGSFSDDRNDSSPPPIQNNRSQAHLDEPQSFGPPTTHHYPQRIQQRNQRGPRHHTRNQQQDRQQFYDNNNYSRQRQMSQRNYDASDNEFNDQQQDHHSLPHQRANSPRDNVNASSRKIDELSRSFTSQKTDIDELKNLLSKLSTDLDQVRTRVRELESTSSKGTQQNNHQTSSIKESGDWNEHNEQDKRKKNKLLRQREKKAAKSKEQYLTIAEDASQPADKANKILNSAQAASGATDKLSDLTNSADQPSTQPPNAAGTSKFNNRRTTRDRRARREYKDRASKPLPRANKTNVNDDSTTQAAEPSSEDRPEGDDGREGAGKERVRVFRRKKQHFGRQGGYNRRRRADSSERNSNDTSPQGEANGIENYQQDRRKRNSRHPKKTYPELSEAELSEVVQNLKREFFNQPAKAIKETMNDKGPKVVYEFAVSILDHAICDVTSPTKLSEIASSLYQLLVSEDNTYEVDFQKGFYDALSDISKREDDIAIDAPRYMDTLGQLLGDCVTLINLKYRHLVRKFLHGCLNAYCQLNRPVLLASIMKAVAGIKTERFAKGVWDNAQLSWSNYLNEGTDLNEFLESHDVKFTTQEFSPEPRQQKKSPKELEKFADDVTALVEKRCTPQDLEDLVKELNYEPEERVDYLGTLVYAIVRGCLVTESGDYKLNNEALNKYSSILNAKHEDQDAIALHALTALTKLWHSYNCPQDLFRTILLALHNQGAASYAALNDWLNSEGLNNIPGIGAARLNSKRYIEDLGANLKSQADV